MSIKGKKKVFKTEKRDKFSSVVYKKKNRERKMCAVRL